MKTIIYIALLCLSCIVFSQEKRTTVAVNATVTFGRQGADCRGRGFCSFSTNIRKRKANATIIYNKDHSVTITINRSKLSKEELLKLFGDYKKENSKSARPTFVMETDLVLNKTTKANLKGALQIAKIAKGNYPITITKNEYIITLKLE